MTLGALVADVGCRVLSGGGGVQRGRYDLGAWVPPGHLACFS